MDQLLDYEILIRTIICNVFLNEINEIYIIEKFHL